MQFVWVYWHGGARNDELRWSMRSVLQNYRGAARLMLVGDKPDWYEGPHIPVARLPPGRHRAFRDSMRKLLVAVASPLVEENFIWMMDDIYLVRPMGQMQLKIRYYQNEFTAEKIETWQPGNNWLRIKQDTMRVLLEHGLPLRDYATHLPHYIEKEELKRVLFRFNPGAVDRTLLWEVLYGNTHTLTSQRSQDVLFRVSKSTSYDAFKNQKQLFVNNGNHGWNEALRGYLYESFPNRTPFETIDAAKPRSWYRTGPPELAST